MSEKRIDVSSYSNNNEPVENLQDFSIFNCELRMCLLPYSTNTSALNCLRIYIEHVVIYVVLIVVAQYFFFIKYLYIL